MPAGSNFRTDNKGLVQNFPPSIFTWVNICGCQEFLGDLGVVNFAVSIILTFKLEIDSVVHWN